jgi:hypothetical protein
MRLLNSTTGLVSTAFIGIAAATPLAALGQDAQDDSMILDIRYAGLAGVEPHEKDADAYRALMMLGERLAEIPGEADGPKEARDGIEMLWEMLRGATSLRIDQSNEAPGVSIAISNSPAAPMSGEAFLGRIVEFVENTGGPIDRDEQGHFVQSPVGPVRVDAADGTMVSIRLGTDKAAATEVQSYGLPANTDPIMSGQIDLQKLGQFAAQIIAEEEPDFAELLEEYQWAIDEAPLAEFAYGKDDQYQIITSRMYDSKEWLSKLGTDSSITFEREHMASIPQDATVAAGFSFSLDFMLGMIDKAAEEAGEDPFAMIEEELGFDVRGDVLENIGPHFMYYQADSTGGGGFLSSILMCEIKNAPDLMRAHTNLRNRFNEFTGDQANGYIRIRTWNSGGHDVYSLVTPGLPVPFEPSWAILGENLVVAGTPLGLSAAIHQLDQSESSVLDNPKFAEAVLEIMPGDEVASFAFGDTERLATHGYSGLNYLLSGLSNAVRSPSDPDREAGILTPSYSTFVKGIKPRGTVSYWDGDDYLTMSRLDGSVLVETAEAFGFIGSSQGAIAGGAMGVGILLPALGKARESAQQLKSATQVRALGQSAYIYANANDGKAPDSVDVLVAEEFIDREMLESPFGPAYDGMGDIVLRSDLTDEQLLSHHAGLVVIVDRAMYLNGENVVNVGFADNHVESISPWELDDILDQEINAGAREELNLD